jgi:poly(3-hydroxyalkanoate) synthetase
MSIYIVERGYYEDHEILGVFSSLAMAEESMNHWKDAADAEPNNWYSDWHYWCTEHIVDEYYSENLTKLHKALK